MAGSTSKRRPRRIAGTVAAGFLLAVLVAVVLLKSEPSAYRRTAPMGRDRQALRAFNRRVVNHVGNVLLDESGQTVLDLVVTEAMVNARIARFLADEARAGRDVPPALAHLRVAFEPGVVVVATRLGRGWSRVVAAQYFAFRAGASGRLRVEPVGTSVGRLPLPAGFPAMLRAQVARGLGRGVGDGGGGGAGEDEEDRLRLAEAVLDALDGKPVPLGEGERRIYLESVEVERGVLRMRGRRAKAAG